MILLAIPVCGWSFVRQTYFGFESVMLVSLRICKVEIRNSLRLLVGGVLVECNDVRGLSRLI